jgi:hypothetical protein
MKTILKDIPLPSLPVPKKRGGKRTQAPLQQEQKKPYKKKPIPVAIREATWVLRCGRVFEHKCLTTWCPNMLTVFEFQAGHDIPESKGGATKPENLYPICSRCNQSMGNRYTFKEWCEIQAAPPPPQEEEQPLPRRGWRRWFQCFFAARDG